MKGPLKVVVPAIPVILTALLYGSSVSPATRIATPIIVTAAPVYEALAGLHGAERFPLGAHLMRIEEGSAEPLVNGFYATADADVSFDATHVLFAGKQSSTSPWQIWELTIADHSVRRIPTSTNDAVRPLYLPGDRFVYAERESSGFRMQAAKTDGSTVLPLTYMAASALPSAVLRDGRILFQSAYPLNAGETPELYLVYSDGSGLESYRCDHGAARWGGTQLASGDVVFTHGSALARFTSPLAVEVPISLPAASYAGRIAETANGEWLVSAKAEGMQHFVLRLWKPGTSNVQVVFHMEDENVVDPVFLSPRPVPNRHPSALHNWTTANLLALDARQSRNDPLTETPSFVQLESQDNSGHTIRLGRAPVEADGSFFVQVPGDHPLRFALLNSEGAVIRQEQGWFWSRAGEQRICVGCHTGPERAPDNRIPAVLLLTTTPVDLSLPGHSTAKGGN
jgi:hypothetical protein